MYTGTSLASAWESEVGGRKLRVLALAVLCSLVVHALILALLSQIKESVRARAAPPPMTARLATPRPPPEPPVVEPLRLPLTRAVPNAKPQARPTPVAVAVPSPPAPMLSIEPSKQAAEPVLVVPAPPPVARAEIQPVPAAASGPDPASVARYRLELMEIAARYERYPRIALENDWEGRVELRIAFAESGAIASMSVKKSTGRAVLDEEAQAMIRSAQPHTVIPPALRGRAFALDVAVIFRLKK